jgi:serine protease AprX
VQNKKTGLENGWNAISRNNDGRKDKNGHGTLIASIISNREHNLQGNYYGVSPDSTIVPVQVLDKEGKGSYSQVIDGIQWAIEHKDEYNIRVMNLSLSAPVRSHYWADPLNQAVMKAWQSGIVVVVAAGNGGPDPMSIGVPGNNPYVITVGALTDAYTPTDWADDYVPTFSAAGPTYEGFVKPDLVAPGGHVVGLMSDKCELAKEHPNYKIDKDYYMLTGTSMSAAQVSGVVALMLANDPDLTPDQVKYRLLASAVPALTAAGRPAFSIWQQGTGRVDAFNAVYGNFNGVANQGLDINADLAGSEHFAGFTLWDPDSNQFYLGDQNGQPVWDGYTWGGGVAWSEAYTWGGGVAWSEAYTWGGGVAWSEAYTWGGGVAWSEAFTLGGGVAWSEVIPWNEASASLVGWVMNE